MFILDIGNATSCENSMELYQFEFLNGGTLTHLRDATRLKVFTADLGKMQNSRPRPRKIKHHEHLYIFSSLLPSIQIYEYRRLTSTNLGGRLRPIAE